MNELENLWNADSLLKLSEDLQVENEQYRLQLAQKENQIQTHLSDVQKLKSQILSMQSTIAEQGQEIQKLNAHIARLAESDLVLLENKKLAEANQKLLVENQKAQNTFKEANTKTEDAKKILADAKALNGTFDKRVNEKVSRVKRNMEADMKGRLQTALQKQTIALSIWTWAFCFICMIQTGYIIFMNQDITRTIPRWFINRWENGCDIAVMIARLYQWCYGYLTNYMHSYVAIGVVALVTIGIVAVGFVLLRNVFDWLGEKWHDRWQYYEVYGEIRLRKVVSVALCIVSVTFALIAGKYIPLDINVVSWWLGFSIGLNLLYHDCVIK